MIDSRGDERESCEVRCPPTFPIGAVVMELPVFFARLSFVFVTLSSFRSFVSSSLPICYLCFFLKSLLLFSSPLHFTPVTLFNLRRFVTSAYVSSRPLTRFLFVNCFPLCQTVLLV